MNAKKYRTDNIIKACAILTAAGIFILPFSACSQGGQKQTPQQQSAKQQVQVEKEPKELKDMEAGIEEIIGSLDGPSLGTAEEKQKGGASQSSKGSESKPGGKESQQKSGDQQGKEQAGDGQGKEQAGGGQGAQQQTPQKEAQPKPEDPWSKIGGVIAVLHYQWNEYMPDAAKKGATLKMTENFSNALNHLTVSTPAKNKVEVLKAANSLYAVVPDLYSLYRIKMSPEIKRMAYFTRNIVLDSMTDDWAQADKDMSGLEASWSIARNSLGKEQQKDSGKLDFSITELKKVVVSKNKQLTDIKGRVALSNIGAVVKSYEKESQQGGESSGAGSGGSQ